MTVTHQELKKRAAEAIEALANDMSVGLQVVVDSLEDLDCTIHDHIDCMKDDLKRTPK